MDPVRYLTIIGRRWRLIVLATLIGVTAALLITPRTNVSYAAVHRLMVKASSPSAVGGSDGGRGETLDTRTSSMAALITGGEVARRAAEKLGGEDTALRNQVEVATEPKAGLINVTARAETAQRAVDVADAFATELIAYLTEQAEQERQQTLDFVNGRMVQLQAQLGGLDAQMDATTDDTVLAQLAPQRAAVQSEISTLSQTLDSLSAAGPPSAGVATLENAEARLASEPLRLPDNKTSRVALLGGAGLLLGLGLALVVDRHDTRLRTKEQAERAFGAPVLAEVPWMRRWARRRSEIVTHADVKGAKAAEAYRLLRTSLELMQEVPDPDDHSDDPRPGAHVLLVTSPNPSEGKTTTVANLAATFAEAGKRVVVVDCDFRHPRIEQYFQPSDGVGLSDRAGLSDVLLGGARAPKLSDVVVDIELSDVRVIAAGSVVTNPTELFARGRPILQRVRELGDIIIIDTPPLLAINDASELIPVVDDVVLVARANRTTAESAARTTELMRRLGAPLRGVVLMGAETPGTSSASYYYYSSEQHRSWWRHPSLWFRRGSRRPSGRRMPAPGRAAGPRSIPRPKPAPKTGAKRQGSGNGPGPHKTHKGPKAHKGPTPPRQPGASGRPPEASGPRPSESHTHDHRPT